MAASNSALEAVRRELRSTLTHEAALQNEITAAGGQAAISDDLRDEFHRQKLLTHRLALRERALSGQSAQHSLPAAESFAEDAEAAPARSTTSFEKLASDESAELAELRERLGKEKSLRDALARRIVDSEAAARRGLVLEKEAAEYRKAMAEGASREKALQAQIDDECGHAERLAAQVEELGHALQTSRARESEVSTAQAQLAEVRTELFSLQQRLADYALETAQQLKRAEGQRAASTAFEAERERAEAGLRDQIGGLQDQERELLATLEEIRGELTAAHSTAAHLRDELAALQAAKDRAEADLHTQRGEAQKEAKYVAGLKAQIVELESSLETHRLHESEIIASRAEVDETRQKFSSLRQELDQAAEELARRQQSLDDQKTEIFSLKSKLATEEARKADLAFQTEKLSRRVQQLEFVEKDLAASRVAVGGFTGDLEKLRQELAQSTEKTSAVSAQLAAALAEKKNFLARRAALPVETDRRTLPVLKTRDQKGENDFRIGDLQKKVSAAEALAAKLESEAAELRRRLDLTGAAGAEPILREELKQAREQIAELQMAKASSDEEIRSHPQVIGLLAKSVSLENELARRREQEKFPVAEKLSDGGLLFFIRQNATMLTLAGCAVVVAGLVVFHQKTPSSIAAGAHSVPLPAPFVAKPPPTPATSPA